jgi:hypothetical protein
MHPDPLGDLDRPPAGAVGDLHRSAARPGRERPGTVGVHDRRAAVGRGGMRPRCGASGIWGRPRAGCRPIRALMSGGAIATASTKPAGPPIRPSRRSPRPEGSSRPSSGKLLGQGTMRGRGFRPYRGEVAVPRSVQGEAGSPGDRCVVAGPEGGRRPPAGPALKGGRGTPHRDVPGVPSREPFSATLAHSLRPG